MVFWKKKQPQPPEVNCYGKLPATGDFIRHNAMGPDNGAFDQWLQGSLNLAKQSMGDNFRTMYEPSVGLFIYRGDDAGGEPDRGMIGCWAASGDSAGRSYPMVVSCSYDYDQLLGVGPALPIAVWPFLTAAYDLVTNGRGLSVDEFLGRVRQIQPISLDQPEQALAGYRDWLANNQMRAFWETTFGTIEPRHYVAHIIHASVEIFIGQECPQTNLAIRFPIGPGDAYAACVWMDMTLRMAKWQRTVLNAFWTPQHDLVVHMGPPHVATYRELIAASGDAEHLTDLLRPPSIDAATARQRLGPLAEVIDNPDVSIAHFLEALR